jgi:hypothetical protein
MSEPRECPNERGCDCINGPRPDGKCCLTKPPSVRDIPDYVLLRRAVQNARGRYKNPRSVHVMNTFGLGSTYAAQLCARFFLDPDERL